MAGVAVDTAAVDITVVDGGVEPLGVNTSCAGWAGRSSAMAVAQPTATVARTTPVRTIRVVTELVADMATP